MPLTRQYKETATMIKSKYQGVFRSLKAVQIATSTDGNTYNIKVQTHYYHDKTALDPYKQQQLTKMSSQRKGHPLTS